MATMTRKKDITGPLKWHGGKSYLADWIISIMPPRCKNPNAPTPDDDGWLHYVEPYFGGGAVLLANDPEGISEVVNDKNGDLTNFWRTLQAKEKFNDFMRIVQAVPFSSVEFSGVEIDDILLEKDPVEAAVQFFIFCRQSLSGRMKGFASITRGRTRRGMNEQVSAWLNCIEGLPEVHARLKRVLILNDDALTVIKKQDGPRTLFYLDPPYCHDTRATTDEYGANEMDFSDHSKLLAVLRDIEGRFLLSGYRSNLYDGAAKEYSWNRHEKKIDNKAAGGKSKREMVECVWTNFPNVRAAA